MRNFILRISDRCGFAASKQILGLILQMAKVRTVRKRTRCIVWTGQSDLLSSNRPLSAHRAERRFAKIDFQQVGFCPFRGPDASPTHSQHTPTLSDAQPLISGVLVEVADPIPEGFHVDGNAVSQDLTIHLAFTYIGK
jgi:hypothetical protein